MKKDKKFFTPENQKYLKFLAVILASILFFVIISNISTVSDAISKVLGVFSPLILGLCIAFVVNLPLRFLEERVFGKLTRKNGKVWSKLKRPLCLTLSVLFLLSVITVFLSFVVPELVRTGEKFFTALPSAMENISATIDSVLEKLHLKSIFPDLTIDWKSISAWALDMIDNHSNSIAQGALGIVTTVFNTVLNFILGFVFSIYVLASKESLGKLAKSIIYSIMKRERARKLISVVVLSNKAFSGFISGQCTEVLLIGVLCFIGMLIFRMPYAVMVSCVIAFTAFIPVFGPFIGTAIGAFFIFIESPIKALWFVIFIIILQQLESNIIYPRIMGKHVGLPGIWVLAAVTIGGGLFGVVGIIVSVPICSVIYTLFDRWIKKRLEERNICHKTMSHDSSEPKSLIDELSQYQFEEDYEDDFEDDVYTDDGELQKAYRPSFKKEPKKDKASVENAPTSDEPSNKEENE
ncbi:MAG: AI-2E family transporter [Clostridia bacterium]|nr:AI-2E family transporter [Clostridia bacterium]